MPENADKVQKLIDQLNDIQESIDQFDLKSDFSQQLQAFQPLMQNKARINLEEYHQQLQNFLLSDQGLSKLDGFNNPLAALINQAKLELYTQYNSTPAVRPLIRELTVNFLGLHSNIFRKLVEKAPYTEAQLHFLGERITRLRGQTLEVEKLKILEFIAELKLRVSSHFTEQLHQQMRISRFNFFAKNRINRKFIEEIHNFFEDLQSKPFSINALLGVLNRLKEDFQPLINSDISEKISQFLEKTSYSSQAKHHQRCMEQFKEELESSDIVWPTLTPLKTSESLANLRFFKENSILDSENQNAKFDIAAPTLST